MLKADDRRARPGAVRRAADDQRPVGAGDGAARARGHVLARPLRRARRGPAAAGARRARAGRGLPHPAAHHRRRQPRGADRTRCADWPGRAVGRRPRRRLPLAAARRRAAGLGGARRSTALRDALPASATSSRPTSGAVFGTIDRAHADAARASPHSHQVAESRRPDAHRRPVAAGRDGEHDPRPRLAHDRRRPLRSSGRCRSVTCSAATTTERRGIDVDREVLNAVLASTESAVTHRRRYRGYVRPAGVLELLLMDTDNPRSLAFALARAARPPRRAARCRPAPPARSGCSPTWRPSSRTTDVAALVAIGGVDRPNLEAFLDGYRRPAGPARRRRRRAALRHRPGAARRSARSGRRCSEADRMRYRVQPRARRTPTTTTSPTASASPTWCRASLPWQQVAVVPTSRWRRRRATSRHDDGLLRQPARPTSR